MRKKRDEQIIIEIMKKYGFTRSVPLKRQQEIINAKDDNAKKILKRIGIYSPFIAFLFFIKHLLSRFGINFSLGGIKVLLTFIALSIITASAIIVINFTDIFETDKQVQLVKPVVTETKTVIKEPKKEKKTIVDRRQVIEVGLFDVNAEDKNIGKKLTNKITFNLSNMQNDYKVIKFKSNKQKSKYFVSGRIDKDNSIRIILYTTTNAAIKFIYKNKIDDSNTIQIISTDFSTKVIEKLKGLK